MTPQSQHTASDWYKPCLPPHRGGVVVTVPEQRQCGVVTMGQEQGQMMGLEQGHNIDDHQRQCVMVTAEPHYSVPRNNSRVTPITTDHSNSGPAHVAAAHKQEPETDKTPTNEAGKMMDLLETVCKMILLKGNIFNISCVQLDLSSESCSSGYDSNDVPHLHSEESRIETLDTCDVII